MKRIRHVLIFVLTILLIQPMVPGLTPILSAAADSAAHGACGADGADVTWELTEDGTLTIRGSGKMRAYSPNKYSSNRSPFYENYSIKKIVIDEGVTQIGDYAFLRNDRLESVTLPATLKAIGNGAFLDCAQLNDITLPDGLESIGSAAFSSTGLKELHIPASVFKIGSAPTAYSVMESFSVDDANPAYTAVDGVLFTKDMKKLCAYPDAKPGRGYTVPDGVETIGKGAFHLLPEADMLYLPLSVRELEPHSLDWGGGSVYYAGTAEQWDALIGDREDVCKSSIKVYFGAAGLPVSAASDAVIAQGECGVDGSEVSWTLTKNGTLTFTGAGAMGAPTIPVAGSDSPASICTPGVLADNETCLSAAMGCETAEEVRDAMERGLISPGSYYNSLAELTLQPVRRIVVGEGITALKDGALRGACAVSVSLPQSLTEICDRAFADTHIENITIPANVTRIGAFAFADSTLYQLTVESGTLTASPDAFGNAYYLRYLIINNDELDFSGLSVPCGAEGFAFTTDEDFSRYIAFRKIRAMLPHLPAILDLADGTEARIREIMREEGCGASDARVIDRARNADAICAGLAFFDIAVSIDIETLAAHCRNYIRSAIGLDIQSAADIYTPDGRLTDALVKAFRISYGVDLSDAGAVGGDVFYAPVSDLLLLKEEQGLSPVPWLTVKADCGSTPHAICVAAELPFESLSHAFGDWETVVPAGEHTTGQKERVCACGKTQQNVIPAVGRHVWGPWSITRRATETQDGECIRVCKNHDCAEVETVVFPAGSEMPEDIVPEAREDSTQKSIIQFFLKLVNFFKKLFSKK